VKESLRGCWKKEQLFALRQGLELWEATSRRSPTATANWRLCCGR